MKVLSAIFSHLFFFLFSALLSARRCSPVGDVIVKCAERRSRLVLAWINGYFFFLLSLLLLHLFLVLRDFCWEQRGGWNKRRSWCCFGESNQAKEQRILPKLSSRRLLAKRRRSRGRGEDLDEDGGLCCSVEQGPGC